MVHTYTFVLAYSRNIETYTVASQETEPESVLRPIYDSLCTWISKNGSDCLKHVCGAQLFIEECFPDWQIQLGTRVPKETRYLFTMNEQPRILTWKPNIDIDEDWFYNLQGDFYSKIVMVTRLPRE